MTEMQKKMQELISQEELDRAFDARFPKEMQVKLRAAKVAVAGIGGLGSNIADVLYIPAREAEDGSPARNPVSDQSISDV